MFTLNRSKNHAFKIVAIVLIVVIFLSFFVSLPKVSAVSASSSKIRIGEYVFNKYQFGTTSTYTPYHRDNSVSLNSNYYANSFYYIPYFVRNGNLYLMCSSQFRQFGFMFSPIMTNQNLRSINLSTLASNSITIFDSNETFVRIYSFGEPDELVIFSRFYNPQTLSMEERYINVPTNPVFYYDVRSSVTVHSWTAEVKSNELQCFIVPHTFEGEIGMTFLDWIKSLKDTDFDFDDNAIYDDGGDDDNNSDDSSSSFFTHIIDDIKQFFIRSFTPKEGYIKNRFDKFYNSLIHKLPIIEDARLFIEEFHKNISNSASDNPTSDYYNSETPSMFKGNFYLFGAHFEGDFIDFTPFIPYMPFIRFFTVAIIYYFFGKSIIKKIPKVFGGIT